MKARNIKPSFFKNEDLAELPAETRLLFIGLWMLADCTGRLEYRPKRIKAEIFPYGITGNFEKLLEKLCNSSGKFVTHYGDDFGQYLQIENFKKHQSPHRNEKNNNIPELDGLQVITGNYEKLRSPLMNDERGMMNDESSEVLPSESDFENLWGRYPKKDGKKEALRHFKSTVKTMDRFDLISKALDNYIESIKGVNRQYVKNGSTWFNNWEDWKNIDDAVGDIPNVQKWPEFDAATGDYK